jgi:hypothetical protein
VGDPNAHKALGYKNKKAANRIACGFEQQKQKDRERYACGLWTIKTKPTVSYTKQQAQYDKASPALPLRVRTKPFMQIDAIGYCAPFCKIWRGECSIKSK